MNEFFGITLSWTIRAQVLEVRLHRAPCNEIGTATLDELEILAQFIRDGAGGARAMLLYSDRPAGFSAGADLRELHAGIRGAVPTTLLGAAAGLLQEGIGKSAADAASDMLAGPAQAGRRALRRPFIVREVRRFLTRIHAVFNTIDTAPITTVSALHGVVFGGGFELALTTDVRIADRTARFAFPELRLGLIPGFGGIPRLERDVGNAVVRDVLLTGRSLNANRAHAIGLVSQLVAPGQALNAARRAAEQATRFAPHVTRAAKAFAKPLPQARLDAEIETFLALVREPDVEAALDKFVHSTDPRPYLP